MRRNLLFKLLVLTALLLVFGIGKARAEITVKPGQVSYRPGELIVKYRQGVTEEGKMRSRARHGSSRVREIHDLRIERHRLTPGKTVAEAVGEYRADPDVEYAEPDYLVHAMVVPGDPQYSGLWGLAAIHAPEAWDVTTGSSSVVVATIDTGIDYNHSDLKANLWVNSPELAGTTGMDDDGNGVVDDIYGYNAIANNGNPMDDNSHGTHVAGTIGAVGNNGIGVVGVNWSVQIMACKFLNASGSGYTSDAVECLQYIKQMKSRGVNIVATNNSWGGGGYSQALYDAINAQQEILFIAAAGNSAANNDATASYPADYDLPNIIAVAATTSTDGLAGFSNVGRRTVHAGAPGSNILSTIPGNKYGTMSGTSMATPHVTGLAALLKAQDGTRGWREIKNLILASGDPLPSLDGKTITGRRINASAAVTCIDSRVFSVLKFPATIVIGTPATLSALSVNCAAPAGPVTVSLSGGETILLHDDGVAPDQVAGDGIFSADFLPPSSLETFTFSSSAGSEMVSNIPPLTVTTSSLPAGTVGTAYSQDLTATGGAGGYTWAITAGSLPAGLSLDGSNGIISGAPTAAGSFTFTVQVKDSSDVTASRPLTISVGAAQLTILTTSLPAATHGKVYACALSASGGALPYTWSVSSGRLPSGITLNSSTGNLSGTSRTAGKYSFSIRVKDTKRITATRSLSLTVN
jgi:hypothetical protein